MTKETEDEAVVSLAWFRVVAIGLLSMNAAIAVITLDRAYRNSLSLAYVETYMKAASSDRFTASEAQEALGKVERDLKDLRERLQALEK